jgi:CheY-like chemotaxis protein
VDSTLKKLLLVVDDEPGVLLLLEHYLGEAFDVWTAANGVEVLALLQTGRTPDLVLADIEMPLMDGYELLRRLRSADATRDVPCLMISGKNKNLHYLQAMRLGADGFIGKPFTADEINQKLTRFADTLH